jgi:signal transduction histidine kinase/DNA-binding response OmpR family regulator/streptogramin lyase
VKHIGVEDGLSSRIVYDFYKDSDGFMWIGTSHGLNRWDGYDFKSFFESDGLVNNQVSQMAEDPNGNIWLLHSGYSVQMNSSAEISIINKNTLLISPLKEYLPEKLPFQIKNISRIHSDKLNNLWISTQFGEIYRWDGKAWKLIWADSDKKAVFNFFISGEDLWVNDYFTIRKIQGENTSKSVFDSPPKELRNMGTSPDGKPITLINNKEIWVGDSIWHTLDSRTWQYYQLLNVNIEGDYLLFAPRGNSKKAIFISRENYILQTLELEYEISDFDRGIQFDAVNWGWNNEKVYVISLKKSPFRRVLYQYKSHYGYFYPTRGIWVDENRNELYTLGLGFPKKVNLNTNQITDFGSREALYDNANVEGFLNGLAIIQTADSSIWFTDEGVLLGRYFPKEQEYKIYHYNDSIEQLHSQAYIKKGNFAPPSIQWSLFEDKSKRLWIGHKNGLSYFDSATQMMEVYQKYNGFNKLQESNVYHFHQSQEGIWLATNNGLFLLDTQKGIIDWIHENNTNGKKTPYNHIAHIYEDEDNTFWLASKGGGLIHIDLQSGEYTQFTTQQGLSDNVIYAVYPDDYENLWLSSNNGIMRFNKQTHQISSYKEDAGITHNEFNTISHYQSSDGTLYFGGLSGITAFHPKDFQAGSATSNPIRMTSVEKQAEDGKFTNARLSFTELSKIHLQPSDLGLEIGFSLLQFTDLESVEYAYKIDGLDADWHFLNEPRLRLNGLPYGEYTIQLKAQDDLGIWSEILEIPVFVKKPFYLQTWFLIVSTILFAIIARVLWKQRVRTLLKQKSDLEELVAERTTTLKTQATELKTQAEELKKADSLKTQFFANIHHELRTPLTLIISPLQHFIKQQNGKTQGEITQLLSTVLHNADKLLLLTNEMLEVNKLESSKLEGEKKPTELNSFARNALNQFQSHAELLGIRLSFRSEIQPEKQFEIDRKICGKVITNLLSNAMRFTPKGEKISLEISQEGEILKMKLTDSGIGISEEDLPHVFERFFQTKNPDKGLNGGIGIGLALSKQLALSAGGDLTVESELGKGSEFTFAFPAKESKVELKEAFDALESPNPTSSKPSLKAMKSNITVLVVEDNLELNQYISDLLSENYRVLRAYDGEEGLALVKTWAEDIKVIISDVMMPNLSGTDFFKKLQEHKIHKSIPFLFLTALASDVTKNSVLKTGASGYLLKPFSSEELLAKMAGLVSKPQKVIIEEEESRIATIEMENLPINEAVWIKKVENKIKTELQNEKLNIEELAKFFELSPRQFQRKIKQISGFSPLQFQREIKLIYAKELLESGEVKTLYELAGLLGFKNSSHFKKLFEKRFDAKLESYFGQINLKKASPSETHNSI